MSEHYQNAEPPNKYKPFEFEALKTKNIILFTDSIIWLYYGFQFTVMPSNREASDKKTGLSMLDISRDSSGFGQFMKRLVSPGAFTDIGDMVDSVTEPLIHMTRIFGLFCMYTAILNMVLVFNHVDITDENSISHQRRRLNERFLFRAFLNFGIFILQMTTVNSTDNQWPNLTPRIIANVLVTTLPIVGVCLENPKREEKDYLYPKRVDAMGNVVNEL